MKPKLSNSDKEKLQKQRKKEVKKINKILTSSDESSSRSYETVDQSNYYHKRRYNKQQIWLPKPPDISGGATSAPTGKWLDITTHDDHGRPLTVKAWVANKN
jgi:hypothetical protein